MKSDVLIIGGGASGLMAACSAAGTAVRAGVSLSVTVLEKMPRPGRKIMITGKGRCNFTNVKEWSDFSGHIRSNSGFVRSAFCNFPSRKVLEFFKEYGMESVVERGDRAFPVSFHASDVVDTLVNACKCSGVKIETECTVEEIRRTDNSFEVLVSDGRKWICKSLIVATGGLSYPSTGSTGDGFRWAVNLGHTVKPQFPSLTALVPKGYKIREGAPDGRHIDRCEPLSETGKMLCGNQLKNIGAQLVIESGVAQEEFGDIDFTDGGIEGPVGFQMSRKAVKALINGSRVSLHLDFKQGVPLSELTERVKSLWMEIDRDPRSSGLHEKEKCRIMLGKLMPWGIIPAFRACHPEIMTLEKRGRRDSKLWVNLPEIARALKCWRFDIDGYVGYERAVVTAGGVNTAELMPKTMESRLCPGLYFCGEVMDVDADTGGYNLQTAFSTGHLAGESAAKKSML
ncbi:MAG: aminoacetone oxidase family FAD-binding enzyme [Bacteroidales bacterium]|nr:aminoacetone oxidase family FAD-binding enzyme [Bacteroidales bacterium]